MGNYVREGAFKAALKCVRGDLILLNVLFKVAFRLYIGTGRTYVIFGLRHLKSMENKCGKNGKDWN